MVTAPSPTNQIRTRPRADLWNHFWLFLLPRNVSPDTGWNVPDWHHVLRSRVSPGVGEFISLRPKFSADESSLSDRCPSLPLSAGFSRRHVDEVGSRDLAD